MNGSYNGDNKGWNADDTIVGGSGNYLVIKMRVAKGTWMGVGLHDGVTGDITVKGFNVQSVIVGNNRMNTFNGEWQVLVVDIDNLHTSYYKKGGDSDKVSIMMALYGSANGLEFDLAYAAICDDWAEIDSIVGNDSVIVTNWKQSGTTMETKTPAEVDELAAIAKQ